MTLRLLHVATHGHNIGDGALVAGIHRTLAEDLGVDLDVTEFDVLEHKVTHQRNMLKAEDVDRYNREVDLVVIGGGGMIEGGIANYLSGINFNFEVELLRRFGVPVVFYALGFNQFRNSHFFHRRRLRQLLDVAAELSLPFSVRNDGSKERLERMLGPLPFVQSIPDPGLYVPTETREVPELSTEHVNIVLQLAGDRARQRFGGPLRKWARRIAGRDPMRSLARFVTKMVDDDRARFVLCPHLLTDMEITTEFLHLLPPRVVRRGCTMSGVLKGTEHAPHFFELYRQADLVIGMRGHSSICSVGLGTPFIGLGTHDKVLGFLEDTGLSKWGIDVKQDPGLARLEPLVEEFLQDPTSYRQQIQQRLPGMRDTTRAFHEVVAKQLSNSLAFET